MNLHNLKGKPVGKFSGGMKRRLSVAISFMGNPSVVYLDEPSTVLSPPSVVTFKMTRVATADNVYLLHGTDNCYHVGDEDVRKGLLSL